MASFPFVGASMEHLRQPSRGDVAAPALWDEVRAIVAASIGGARYGAKVRLPHALVMTVLFRGDLTARQKLEAILRLTSEHATNLALFATIYKAILAALKRSSRYLRGKRIGSHPGGDGRSIGRLLARAIVDGPRFLFSSELTGGSALYSPLPPPPSGAGYAESPYHALVAGATGGYLVWGRYSSVNYQIVLYLTSRVLVGLAKRALERTHREPPPRDSGGICSGAPSFRAPNAYPLAAAAVWATVMVLFEESPHVLHPSLRKSMNEIYRRNGPSWGPFAGPVVYNASASDAQGG